ncbi:MAG: preprotein translocase subunit SecG [Parcubacteria group bacterium GW2011_GWA2_38_13b]|nr:MAG: preprotein translocase subunit SecG [Parcubacteria group bacterium GW2011_GWA2_38_13b]
MSNIFNIGQIIVSVILIIAILMQQRGSGLSGAFGGDGNIYRTKRGLERVLFIATIILATLFIGSTMFRIIFSI